MNVKAIPIIYQDDRGTIYDCGKSNFISRVKGSISANHTHPEPETIYLVRGEVEFTVGDETTTVKAPLKIAISGGVYHQLIALTDIDLVYDRYQEP